MDFGSGGPAQCRNADLVATLMTWPVLVFAVVLLVVTWLRGPRAWVPYAGLFALAALWIVCDSLVDGLLI
jgi:hypothetical protein